MAASQRIFIVFEGGRQKSLASKDLDAFVKALSFTSDGTDKGVYIREVGSQFDFNAKKLTNIADGTAAQHAVSKSQMETADGLRLLKAGDTFTGDLASNGTAKITNLPAPTAGGDAANKTYADLKLAKAGDTFTGDLTSNGTATIKNLPTPAVASDAATKGYVDAIQQGLTVKSAVRAISLSNITLSGAQTIDGVSVIATDRVLVAGQTAGADNGIYVAAAGAWSRSTDADISAEVTPGIFTFVTEGTLYSDTGWVLTTDSPITLGTTALAFTQFSGAGAIIAGTGLTKTGNQLDVVAADASILVAADAISVLRDTAGAVGLSGSGIAVNTDGSTTKLLSNAIAVDHAQSFTNDNAGSITVRQVVYVKANGNVDLARADVANLADFELGLVEAATIATTASGKVTVRPGALVGGFSALTPGKLVYVDPTTAGSLTQTAPSASGQFVYSVGRAMSANQIMFDPQFVIEIV